MPVTHRRIDVLHHILSPGYADWLASRGLCDAVDRGNAVLFPNFADEEIA